MIRIFRDEISDPSRFVVTLELVPGTESRGRSVDTVMQMAADAYADGRISAVSITDNPGGNPSLSPDVLANEIFRLGMDVIVHFTCRDMNRAGMESRALQLAMMGIKNILALTGDYSGQGFGGQGAPVFDLDSVNLICMLSMLSERLRQAGDPEEFFAGCAVSPFKREESECFAQYAKLCKKVAAGARFVITQLGYDARKFQEAIQIRRKLEIDVPALGSLYFLTPGIARVMNAGRIPGAVVADGLLKRVEKEWADREKGRKAAIERAARLGAVLKGLGYRGIHIGGVHKRFETVARILDRMGEIENRWEQFCSGFRNPQEKGFYVFLKNPETGLSSDAPAPLKSRAPSKERLMYRFMSAVHHLFFSFDSPFAKPLGRIFAWVDRRRIGEPLMTVMEDPAKKILLSCLKCGDCGIQHVAFLCPESQCPKHIRNGACGGSRNGGCEVYPDRPCVWARAYNRLAFAGSAEELTAGCVPPRMWERNRTSSWINFHLRRDHQSASAAIARFCSAGVCKAESAAPILSPAEANAVFAAAGEHIRKLPVYFGSLCRKP